MFLTKKNGKKEGTHSKFIYLQRRVYPIITLVASVSIYIISLVL